MDNKEKRKPVIAYAGPSEDSLSEVQHSYYDAKSKDFHLGKYHTRMYLSEAWRNCAWASSSYLSLRDIQDGKQISAFVLDNPRPPEGAVETAKESEIARLIYSFLLHGSIVEKIFWPTITGRMSDSKKKLKKDRSAFLRRVVDIEDLTPLSLSKNRNDLVHYDERMDTVLKKRIEGKASANVGLAISSEERFIHTPWDSYKVDEVANLSFRLDTSDIWTFGTKINLLSEMIILDEIAHKLTESFSSEYV